MMNDERVKNAQEELKDNNAMLHALIIMKKAYHVLSPMLYTLAIILWFSSMKTVEQYPAWGLLFALLGFIIIQATKFLNVCYDVIETKENDLVTRRKYLVEIITNDYFSNKDLDK